MKCNNEPVIEVETLDEMCARYVEEVLASRDGNKSRAARALGIDRRSVYRWIDRDRKMRTARAP